MASVVNVIGVNQVVRDVSIKSGFQFIICVARTCFSSNVNSLPEVDLIKFVLTSLAVTFI